MVIEMASTFLLVEHVIDRFTAPAPDLDQQIAIMGGWLLDAATGRSSGEPPPGLRPDFGERIGVLHLRAQVTKEILANLQHVEQVLDAFSREPAKRAPLAELQPYLRQMHGALVVLGMARAAEALAICERLIGDCAKEGHPKVAEDMDWIAEGLSSLGFFLEPCRHGREPVDEAIALFFRRFEKRNAPVSMETTSLLKSPLKTGKPDITAELPPSRPGVDPELLVVFLEEAEEVLQRIADTLPECRSNPEDREALTTVRRAFHTLKGSGRMVGLMDLGEVAWEIEQVMNLWLEQKRPATEALLDLVETARVAFSGWIADLRANKLAKEIDGSAIADVATRLRKNPDQAAAAKPALPDEVTVGQVTLPRNFFDIYVKEAAQHVAALEVQHAEWRKTPGNDVSEEFARAAHTLASSSRTAGFTGVAEVASALEDWTTFASQTAAPADQAAVYGAITELRPMLEALTKQLPPQPAVTATQQLRELVSRFEAQKPPPPVETKAIPQQETGGREKRVMRDDIDEQLLPVFLEEAEELVPHLGSDLRDWQANPADDKVSSSLRRLLHTLKGSARMAGAIRLGELCHMMESKVEAAFEANSFPPSLFEDLLEKMDRLSTDVERMRPRPAPLPAPVAAPVQQVQAPKPQPRVEPPLPIAAGMLRVNADTLDHLINESGEVAIARSRIEAELRGVKQSLSDLSESVARMRGQLREVEVQADSQMKSRLSVMDEDKGKPEYDPLEFDRYTRLQELTRLMAESLNDVVSIQQTLLKNMGDTDAALLQQARIGRELQQELMRIRAVPFNNLNERLYRTVRQSARELDKKVELTVEGAEVEIDRGVLDKIGAPLEHMLRNALAHGIEAPAARAAAGKPESGRISIALRQEANEMVLILSDDGAGLNFERLRRKGLDMGLIAEGEEKSEAELAQLIFISGLSTAEAVTELAGRGVGMDVVKSEISAIGGRVDIASSQGKGTTFTIYLPLTLAVTQAVLVRSGAAILAVSSVMVEQVLRVKAETLTGLYEAQSVSFQDRNYPLHYVRHLFGTAGATEIQPYNSVLLLRSGIQRIALHIDELLANQEVVVKAIGPQLARVPGVVGATVLADGGIVLIVNPVQLAHRARLKPSRPVAPAEITATPAMPTIMVVDDSLTVRKFTSRLLEREGYRVATAKDGVDALEQLKDTLPSVMLVDIEMPRMDGFDLTRNLRADPRTQQLPIIVISSRTAEKHRTHAATLGVNAFLGKPYPEAELLQLIAQYARA
jgi:chemosensory pili system protein ChpA (sensor histidine kinase/response regulator)